MTVNKINIFQSPNDIGINNCRSILLPSTIRKNPYRVPIFRCTEPPRQNKV